MINFGVLGVEIMVSFCCDGLLEFLVECDLGVSFFYFIMVVVLDFVILMWFRLG